MGRQDYETETLIGGYFNAVSAVDLYNQTLTGDVHVPLRTAQGHGAPAVLQKIGVRRLTPTECERLQGFPDGHTMVTHRGKPAADGPRYKALGNSMAVPVMRWIGQRIMLFEKYAEKPSI
jgi:site-specific DNA-cytosine methylase